jgi:hypothetical protein
MEKPSISAGKLGAPALVATRSRRHFSHSFIQSFDIH